MAYLYICAAPGDQLPAEHLTSQLRQMQQSVFLSGQPPVAWQEMQRQLAACDMVMYIISPEAIASGYCQPQLDEAARLNKPIQPVVMRPVSQMPFLPGQIPALDMTQGITPAATSALQAVIGRLGRHPLGSSSATAPKSNRNMMMVGVVAGIGGLILLGVICLIAAIVLIGGDDEDENENGDSQVAGDLTGLTIAQNVETKTGDGNWQAAAAQFILAEGDSVRTDATGRALLTFFTGDETELEPNTELVIETMQGEAGGDNEIQLNVLVGQVTNRVNRTLSSKSRHEVKTPSADAAVRGTVYSVKVEPSGRSTFSVGQGTVAVTAQGQTQVAQAGFEIVVEPGQPPLPPRQVSTPTPSASTLTPSPTASATSQQPVIVPTTRPSATAAPQTRFTITSPANNTEFRASDTITVRGNIQGVSSGQVILVELLDGNNNQLTNTSVTVQTSNINDLTAWQAALVVPANLGAISNGRIRASAGSTVPAQGVSVRIIGAVIPTPTTAPTFTPIPSPTLSSVAFIRILSPAANDIVSPNEFTLTGEAGGIFENTFVLQILVNGQAVAQYPVTFTPAEVGGSARFSVSITKIPVQPGTQGQLYAYATSPRDGSILTETQLIPVVFR